MNRARAISIFAAAAAGAAWAWQTPAAVDVVEVVARPLESSVVIAGELTPWQGVDVYARVSGFVETVHVDRGSEVKRGEPLVTLSAPELKAQLAEARARVVAVRAERNAAAARLAAAVSTLGRLKVAAATPGAVAANELVVAEQAAAAERARVGSLDKNVDAAEAAARVIEERERYLVVAADFDGVITERFAHPGSLAGPESRTGNPLVRIEQIGRLRLVAAVPEQHVAAIAKGARVSFTAPAHPGRTFYGVVTRPAWSLDARTRTMPVELDVANPARLLAPGMYAEVAWPARRTSSSLLVPRTAIKATTERVFVIRVKDGKAEWVDVRRGVTQGDLVEVVGDLRSGDRVVLRATDEIRPGVAISRRGRP